MNSIFINKKEIVFYREVLQYHTFHDIIIVIFSVENPKKERNYNNVIALNLEGEIIWEVEECNEFDFMNPYEGVADLDSHILLFKANSQRVIINRKNGLVIKNLSPISKERPY